MSPPAKPAPTKKTKRRLKLAAALQLLSTFATSVLRITSITRGTPTPTCTTLAWTSVAARFYTVQERPSLASGAWADYLNNPVLGWNDTAFIDSSGTNDFFRIRAYRPLTP